MEGVIIHNIWIGIANDMAFELGTLGVIIEE